MKNIRMIKVLVLCLFLLQVVGYQTAYAQKKVDNKVHLKIMKVENGKKTTIDTTFATNKDAMEYRLEVEENDTVTTLQNGEKMKKIVIESNFDMNDSILKKDKLSKMIFMNGSGNSFTFSNDLLELPDLSDLDSTLSFNMEDIVMDCPDLHGKLGMKMTFDEDIDSIVRGAMKNMPLNFNLEFKCDSDFNFTMSEFPGDVKVIIDKKKGKKGKKEVKFIRKKDPKTF